MAIVDEKGRLFGKINLLDLVVVLAILAVAARFGYKAYKGRQAVAVGEDKVIEMTMRLPAVAEPTIKAIPVGSELYDSKSNTYMGKVVEVRQEPALVVTTGDDGRVYEQPSKNRFDLYVIIAGKGRVSPNGVTMAGLEVKIGRTNFVKNELWAGFGPTWEINTDPKPR